MTIESMRRMFRRHCICLCVLLAGLGALQPFLATHFRVDGWEDEPALRVVNIGQSAQFEADDRPEYPDRHETTVYVDPSADLGQADALMLGVLALIALAALAVGLLIRESFSCFALPQPPCCARVPHQGSPPPPGARQCWRIVPPAAAPPLSEAY